MDRWDIVGACGVALMVVGVWELAGRGWAAIALAVPLLALYVLREMGKARR